MAQLTKTLYLSTTWQRVTSSGFVGQKDKSTIVEVCNADSTPSGEVSRHIIEKVENLQFPAPITGYWYARTDTSTAALTYTEV